MLSPRWAASASASLFLMVANTAVAAPWSPTEISSDPFTGDGAQHATQVEPDTFSFGSTVVAAFQSGRFFFGGGASGIGFATSANGGRSWSSGFLPTLTVATGGSADRATDPSVAYDARHNAWLISSLRLSGPFTTVSSSTTDYAVSRSTDGGLTWSAPVIASAPNASPPPTNAHDKGWIVCDNFASSPFYGRCYLAFSDFVNGRASVVRSDDGGLSWSGPVGSVDSAGGVGLQPVVQPSGTVVVPYLSGTGMRSIRSTNGGASFQASVQIANVTSHVPTGMRALPIPSAEVDGAGTIYVAWQDCRFRAGCVGPTFVAPNDIVYVTSVDGISWSAVTRVPLDRKTSGVDHFIPGLGVNSTTEGQGADLAIAYYYYRNGACTAATCELRVGFTASKNGGKRWRHPRRLSGSMPLAWIADTSFGANSHMVGDYISTSFVSGSSVAVPVFSLGSRPTGSAFRQSIWASAIRVQKH